MSIEDEVFKGAIVDFNKLEGYGFQRINNYYVFEKIFFNDNFKAIITINNKGVVSGKVIDLEFGEEYLGLRVDVSFGFTNKVRDLYKEILIDIKNNCFEKNFFISKQANRIVDYIKDKYNDNPEFLWDKFKGYGVFRNSNNGKWYAIIMNVDLSKLGALCGEVEIVNVKLNEDKIGLLLEKNGYYKAYHMNKKRWISIVLNDTLEDSDVMGLIDESYNLVK